ncbi:EamA family transporter [Halomonas aquamarina]|uniref:EamA family transporter n=1 Tax=Vreelandella aquamarina TaxID=77097 RepID=A0ACC5VX84_9GAMM|nr:EamA family transporter [Halomonas aquamarina]MBZ5488883.1 EamA family transporter [Halomonas aquamarina]
MNTAIVFSISLLASACSHYWQKRSALHFARYPDHSLGRKLVCQPLMLAIFFLLLSAIAWLYVLRDWSVSVAYPMLSLNLIIMLLISRFSFGEPVSSHHWVGCVLIGLGILLVAVSAT